MEIARRATLEARGPPAAPSPDPFLLVLSSMSQSQHTAHPMHLSRTCINPSKQRSASGRPLGLQGCLAGESRVE
ncbi:hypothetical protein AA0117_g13193 [Alternaria alternata]|jgi:hypothetical protein|uniref:Uncharacterized protein n=1 Tax=Alternaria alternata TaxID=5599 RepID=A0A4Q4MRQ8_ALTAL|nr:hypothetical protein AA0117_g13193 [Alternaria alternata]